VRKIIHAELYSDSDELPKLMRDWSSCVRFSYCRFLEDLAFNDVRIKAKQKYSTLNVRQVSDSVMEAKANYTRTKNQSPIVFGGKGLFEKVCKKKVSNNEWKFVRDGNMYSRGDAGKLGNPNLRIIEDSGNYFVRVTVGCKQFRYYSLFVPKKFREQIDYLLNVNIAYGVRLRRKSESKYKVTIDYKVEVKSIVSTRKNGIIGIDTNPTKIALCRVSSDGNFVYSRIFKNTRMFYGSSNKTKYEISILIKEIVKLALENKCAVSAENLNFKPKFEKGQSKWNRIRSRFVWRSFLNLLESKCVQTGVEFIKVNPAFTSVQGKLKYQGMFNITEHEAAAYVIGRRGLGLNEKLSVYQLNPKVMKNVLFGTLQEEGQNINCRFHSWSLWKKLNNIPVLTGHLSSLCNLKELYGDDKSCGANPQRESCTITNRTRNDIVTVPIGRFNSNIVQGGEGHPSQFSIN